MSALNVQRVTSRFLQMGSFSAKFEFSVIIVTNQQNSGNENLKKNLLINPL